MLYHYTVGIRLRQILESGFLEPARAGVPANERPILWLTRKETWEPTANKAAVDEKGRVRSLSTAETEKLCGGLFRIGIADNVRGIHDFPRITRESHQYPAMTRALVKTAKEVGSQPETDWFGTFFPVPLENFLVVDKWDGQGWFTLSTCGH
jgi:hypothetical protein